jgi:chromosome segregation ATPase
VSKREPHRFDLAAALSRSLQPVDLGEFQRKNVNRVRLLKADELQGSVRQAIERALAGPLDELRRAREAEQRASAEAEALRGSLAEAVARRDAAEAALAGASGPEGQAALRAELDAATAKLEDARRRTAELEEEIADLRVTLEAAQADAADARRELGAARDEAERLRLELLEVRERLAGALVERERMRAELDAETTRELPARVAAESHADASSGGRGASGEIGPTSSIPAAVQAAPGRAAAEVAGSAPAGTSGAPAGKPKGKAAGPRVAFFGFGPASAVPEPRGGPDGARGEGAGG